MKKKIALLCLAAFVFCLLTGCAADMPEITTDAAETTVIPEETAAADLFDVPGRKDIYFATGNDYYDLYVGYSWVPGPEIYLFSKEYIDPNSIQVSADIEAEYTVNVTELETGVSLTSYEIIESDGKRNAILLSADMYDIPLYVYQTYAGMDWAELGKMYTEYSELREKYEADEVSYDQVTAAQDRYNYTATEYIKEYSELNIEDIAVFHLYMIQICINNADVEETLTTVQVTADDTVYDVNIGEVYIRPYLDMSNGYDYLSMPMSPPILFSGLPYGKGIEQCQSGTYYAKESLTLTGLHFLDNIMSSVAVLDVIVVIADDAESANSQTGIEIEWDGVTPIYLEQGKYATLFITVQDDRLKEINYHSNLYPVLEFECAGSAYERVGEIPLYRVYSEQWLLYAMGMDGLDMESYFNDFHYLTINEIWRNDVDLTPWGQ